MLKKIIDKQPYCSNCKNNCTLSTKIELNDKKNIEILSYDYCKAYDKLVNPINYLDKCDKYKEGENSETKEVDRITMKKYMDNAEKGTTTKLEEISTKK